jgi:tRNA(adenine34) deaminase
MRASGAQAEIDRHWMELAIAEAERAAAGGEVPVGAVLISGDREVGRGHNQTIGLCDPTAHAEVLALRAAAAALGNYRTGGTLYVTLEPCIMCVGAMVQARVERLVFAARDPKAGAAVSLYQAADDGRLNHRLQVAEGVMAEQAAGLLTTFFASRRLRAGGRAD